MKTLLVSAGVFLLTLSHNCFGQSAVDIVRIYNPSPSSKIEDPYSDSKGNCFNLANFQINHDLTNAEFNSLPLNDKIEYSLFYPESYHQICSFMKPLASDYQNFIHAYVLIDVGERRRSQKQLQTLKANRSIAVKILSECLFSTKFLGRLEKSVIQELNAFECIPGLIEIFKKNKDTELLTFCLQFMKNDKFDKLSESKIHETLYADPAHFSIGRPYIYYQKIPKNEENTNIVLSLAKQYYELKMKEKKMRTASIGIFAVMFIATLQCEAQNSSNSPSVKNANSTKKMSLEACLISGNQEFYDKFKKTKLDFDNTYVYKISNNKLKSFTLKEKIIYCMYFPETYNQICDIIEVHKAKFIYPYIDNGHFEHETSDRQLKTLRDNRDSVIRYVSLCLKSSESLTNSEIWFLEQLNAYECMPDLLNLFSKNGNNEILTYCMQLMKKDKFEPFLKSKEYKGLYAKPRKSKELYYDDHQRHIRRTPEAVSSIVALSNQYYKWKLERK